MDSTGNRAFRACPYAPLIDPIFGSGIAIMPPAPNTQRLNIERLDQFRPRREFLSERSPLPRQCGAFATYRRISCLLASTICRGIAARRIGGAATIRTRGETRMTGMKHSPRTDLLALYRGAPGEGLCVPLASFLSLSSAP